MKKRSLLVGLVGLLLTGCAATGQPEYVWVVDEEKMQQVIKSNASSTSPVNIVWVNAPKKRVKSDSIADN